MRAFAGFAFFFSPNSIVLQADYVTVVEDRPIMSVKYCLPVPAKVLVNNQVGQQSVDIKYAETVSRPYR